MKDLNKKIIVFREKWKQLNNAYISTTEKFLKDNNYIVTDIFDLPSDIFKKLNQKEEYKNCVAFEKTLTKEGKQLEKDIVEYVFKQVDVYGEVWELEKAKKDSIVSQFVDYIWTKQGGESIGVIFNLVDQLEEIEKNVSNY